MVGSKHRRKRWVDGNAAFEAWLYGCLQRRKVCFGRAARLAALVLLPREGTVVVPSRHSESESGFISPEMKSENGVLGVCPCVGMQLQKSSGGSQIQRSERWRLV